MNILFLPCVFLLPTSYSNSMMKQLKETETVNQDIFPKNLFNTFLQKNLKIRLHSNVQNIIFGYIKKTIYTRSLLCFDNNNDINFFSYGLDKIEKKSANDVIPLPSSFENMFANKAQILNKKQF